MRRVEPVGDHLHIQEGAMHVFVKPLNIKGFSFYISTDDAGNERAYSVLKTTGGEHEVTYDEDYILSSYLKEAVFSEASFVIEESKTSAFGYPDEEEDETKGEDPDLFLHVDPSLTYFYVYAPQTEEWVFSSFDDLGGMDLFYGDPGGDSDNYLRFYFRSCPSIDAFVGSRGLQDLIESLSAKQVVRL